MRADDDFQNPKANIAPKAKPQRRNGGEGMPPLPLPATPLRRSEKKREPAPPALIGNITFAANALKGGTWSTTIIDIERWVEFTNSQLGQKYRYVGTDFTQVQLRPNRAADPVLHRLENNSRFRRCNDRENAPVSDGWRDVGRAQQLR